MASKKTKSKVRKVIDSPILDSGAREKLILAGSKLFAARGLEGVSTRDIAAEAGLNLSLISYYFGGKEGLYLTIVREFALVVKETLGMHLDKVEKLEFSQESFREVIGNLVDTLVEIRIANPEAAMLISREKLSGMPNTKDVHDQIFVSIGEKVRNLIVKGQKNGMINKSINPAFFMCCLAESINGYFVMSQSATVGAEVSSRCYSLPKQKEEFTKQIVLLFLEGILR